jgi:hypothetical protein
LLLEYACPDCGVAVGEVCVMRSCLPEVWLSKTPHPGRKALIPPFSYPEVTVEKLRERLQRWSSGPLAWFQSVPCYACGVPVGHPCVYKGSDIVDRQVMTKSHTERENLYYDVYGESSFMDRVKRQRLSEALPSLVEALGLGEEE